MIRALRTRTRRGLLVLAALLSPLAAADAGTLNVPSTMYPTIQVAINLASADDEIVVAPGTYFERVNFLGKRLTLRSSGGAEVTTIDAIGQLDSVITILTANASGSVVEGFTLKNGQATGAAPDDRGGGIYIDIAQVTVRDCVIVDNEATVGGGLYANASTLTIEGVTFQGNNAVRGGGVYLNNATLTMTGTMFKMNEATITGGGAWLGGGSSFIDGCQFVENVGFVWGGGIEFVTTHQNTTLNSVFHGNSTGSGATNEGRGAAVYCGGSTATSVITNSLFTDNFAQQFGAALYAARPITARNCTFVGNSAGSNEPVAGNVNTTLRNCIAWGNTSPGGNMLVAGPNNSVQYSIIEGGYPGTGNIGADPADEPIFVDPMDGDFRLAAGSPGIDAGNSTLLPVTISTDFNGAVRVVNGLASGAPGVPVFGYFIDMGAFEFQPDVIAPPTCLGDINGDGVIDAGDLGILLNVFGDVCP